MNNEITSRTVYTTCDGIEFTHLELAEHHIRTCNVLMNCLLAKPKSEHYHTIWELLKHHQIIDRHDAEYYLQENTTREAGSVHQ